MSTKETDASAAAQNSVLRRAREHAAEYHASEMEAGRIALAWTAGYLAAAKEWHESVAGLAKATGAP